MQTDLFPAAFWPLALAHGVALISPGPDFMLILSHGARHRLAGSAFLCAGIALGNAAYIGLAILGWAGVRDHPGVYRGLEALGSVYLAWLGWKLLRSAKTPFVPGAAEARRLAAPAQLAVGLGSALLNPKNMIFYLSIMTVLIESEAVLRQRIAAGVWMCLAVLGWDLFVAAAVSSGRWQERLWKRVPLIERVSGVVLLFFASSLWMRPLVAGLFGSEVTP